MLCALGNTLCCLVIRFYLRKLSLKTHQGQISCILLSITLKQSQVDLKSYKGLSSHFKQCQITSNDFKNFSTFADVQYSPGGLFYHYNLYAPYYNDQKKFPRVEVIYLRDRISVDLKTKVSIFRSHIDQPSRVAWNCGGHDDLPIAILHFVPITLTA
jgi:hypothetical protein